MQSLTEDTETRATVTILYGIRGMNSLKSSVLVILFILQIQVYSINIVQQYIVGRILDER